MDKKYVYMHLRRASMREDNNREIELLEKETKLNARTIKGLIKIIDHKEIIKKEELENWLDPEFYTKENMKMIANDEVLSMLIPTYFYEDADFVKECKITSLPRGFMENNKKIKTFIVVPGIKTISAKAFKNCKNLIAIYFAENIEEIEDEAFMGCNSLTSVWLPNSVKKIGKRGYKDCVRLEQVFIPPKVQIIKKSTFENCMGLVEVNTGSKEIDVEENSFKGCISLKFINYKNKHTILNEIGKESFNGCKSLEEIVIKSSEIEERAFLKCISLKTIYIKKNLMKIHEDAFVGCKDIEIKKNGAFNNIELMSIEGKEELMPLLVNI